MSWSNPFPSSVEEFTAEVESEFAVDQPSVDPMQEFEDECLRSFGYSIDFLALDDFDDDGTDAGTHVDDAAVNADAGSVINRRPRSANAYPFEFGDVCKSNWYFKFLHPSVRERTYHLSSRDRFGDFRSLFRMTLEKVDDLVSLFISNNWIYQTKHCRSEEEMHIKAELHILAVLKVLGHHSPFRTLRIDTNICASEHRTFFHHFISKMHSIRDQFITYPSTEEELQKITSRYEENFLPGCGGPLMLFM